MHLPVALSSVQTFPCSAGCVLFWPPGERVWVLNPTAALIWDMMKDGLDAAAAELQYSDLFGISREQACLDIDVTIAGFREAGLLAGGVPDTAPSDLIRLPHCGDSTAPEAFALQQFIEFKFILGGRCIVLTAGSEALIETFKQQMGALITRAQAADTALTQIQVGRSTQGQNLWNISIGNTLCDTNLKCKELLPALMTLLFVTCLENLGDSLLLHAAVLVRDNRAILLPGQAGSGKTTLCAALGRNAGWRCYSDEIAVINVDDLSVSPLLLPFSIKPGSLEVLGNDYPHLSSLPLWQRADGKQVRYLCPPQQSLPGAGETVAIERIIFPRFDPAAQTALAELDKCEALQLLALSGSSNRKLQSEDVAAMIALVERSACSTLTYHCCEEAVKLL